VLSSYIYMYLTYKYTKFISKNDKSENFVPICVKKTDAALI